LFLEQLEPPIARRHAAIDPTARARHTGHSVIASAGSVTAAIARSWALLTVHLGHLSLDALSRRFVHGPRSDRRCRRAAAPPPYHDEDDDEAGQETGVGDDPHQQAEALSRRGEQDPDAVLSRRSRL